MEALVDAEGGAQEAPLISNKRRAVGNQTCVGHRGRTIKTVASSSRTFRRTREITLKGGKAYKCRLDQVSVKALICIAEGSGFQETSR